MRKSEVIKRLEDCGVVAIVRADNAEQAIQIADACIKAGIVGIEITFTVPGALSIIESLRKRYKPEEIIIGAGTVLDPETARAAILAGALFIVSPCLNVETVKTCLRYQIACFPGAMTIAETLACMEAGADIVKVFPANLFGPQIIKLIHGPLPQALIMPTGHINVENAGDWIRAGAVAVGAGSDLTEGAKRGDFESIVRIGRQLIEEVRKARQ